MGILLSDVRYRHADALNPTPHRRGRGAYRLTVLLGLPTGRRASIRQDISRSCGSGISGRLLAIDDWLLAPLSDGERRDLLEVIEDRSERASTLIASQLPATAWHAAIGEPSVADAICDRLIHQAHRLTLKGPTMREPETRRGRKATA